MVMPITIDGEDYFTAAEAAKYLNMSRETFYQNAKDRLTEYEIGLMKRTYYKKSELDLYKGVRPREKDTE